MALDLAVVQVCRRHVVAYSWHLEYLLLKILSEALELRDLHLPSRLASLLLLLKILIRSASAYCLIRFSIVGVREGRAAWREVNPGVVQVRIVASQLPRNLVVLVRLVDCCSGLIARGLLRGLAENGLLVVLLLYVRTLV